MLFVFAGSSHSKYTAYLLETICNLELESSPELHDAILRGSLINLSGKAGGFSAGDTVQEFFNRLLEAVVERKGVEYGANFIRNVISRNLHHFARIKLDLRVGVGLAARSGGHKCPHLKPEVQTLLEEYRKTELHRRREGRAYDNKDTDNFCRGMNKLRNGKLAKWITETTTTRGLNLAAASDAHDADSTIEDKRGDESEDEDSEEDEEDEEDEDEGNAGNYKVGDHGVHDNG
jgi:hypothetical protein